MRYYSLYASEINDIKAEVLNDQPPFQIDFDYVESRRSRPVDIYDCTAPKGGRALKNFGSEVRPTRSSSGSFVLSSGAYHLLLPYLNACTDWQEVFFNRLRFYSVGVYSFLAQQKNNRGYWAYTEFSLKDFHLTRPPDIHCFGVNSKIFVTEVFKQCVEENGLTGFGLYLEYDSESEEIV